MYFMQMQRNFTECTIPNIGTRMRSALKFCGNISDPWFPLSLHDFFMIHSIFWLTIGPDICLIVSENHQGLLI